jgi:hypothetical protein
MANTFPSEGNVGLGTTLPEQLLHIKAGDSSGGKSRIIIENSLGHKWFLNTFSTKNHFSIGRVGVSDDLAIDAKGNIGIGVDNARAKLEVNGHVIVNGVISVSDDKVPSMTISPTFLVDLLFRIGSLESRVSSLESQV